jgi:hypothetical protein
MDAAFSSNEFLTSMSRDMAKVISECNGMSKRRQFTWSQVVAATALGFTPRDLVEARLAGRYVMFHELVTDNIGEVPRDEVDTVRHGARRKLVALNKSFTDSLGRLERYQPPPSEGPSRCSESVAGRNRLWASLRGAKSVTRAERRPWSGLNRRCARFGRRWRTPRQCPR